MSLTVSGSRPMSPATVAAVQDVKVAARELLKAKRKGKPEGDSDRLLQGGELQEDGSVTSPKFAKLAPYPRDKVRPRQWYHGIDVTGGERWFSLDPSPKGTTDGDTVYVHANEAGVTALGNKEGVDWGLLTWAEFDVTYRISGEIVDVVAAAKALNKDARKRLEAKP